MKWSTIAAVASLVTLATTKPLGGKHHHNHKRLIVYETYTAEVIETQFASTTVWITEGEVPPSTTTAPTSPPETHPTPVHTRKVYTKPAAEEPFKKQSPPAAKQEPSSTPASFVPPPPVSTTTTQTPAPAPATTEASSPPPTTTAVPPPPVTTTPPPPPPPPPATTVAPPPSSTVQATSTLAPYVPPPPAAAPPPSSGGSTGGSSGDCGTIGGTCSGDITYYQAGLGACGTSNDGASEDVVALAHEFMGSQSNGNPFCGRKVKITVGGKSAIGTIADKCMGCDGQSLDLSNHLYDQLADEAVGRLHDVEWCFTT